MLRKITLKCQRCGATERLVVAEDEPIRPLCKHCLPEGERATGIVLERPSRPGEPGATGASGQTDSPLRRYLG